MHAGEITALFSIVVESGFADAGVLYDVPDVCVLLKGIHRRKQSLPKRRLGKMFTYDPISPVAMEISNETCLLCFDEFQVSVQKAALFLKAA